MNTRHLLTAALAAATLGMAGTASADDDRRHGPRGEFRAEQRHDHRAPGWDDRRDGRWDNRRDDRWDDRRFERHGGYTVQRDVRIVHEHRYGPRAGGPRWHRGGYVPRDVWQHRRVSVNHQHHPRLYAAPRGHQWVQVDGEFLLVAVATGLIANVILNR